MKPETQAAIRQARHQSMIKWKKFRFVTVCCLGSVWTCCQLIFTLRKRFRNEISDKIDAVVKYVA